MYSNIQMPSAKQMVSTAASMAATAMLVRSFAKDLVPNELRLYLSSKFFQFLNTFTNEITLVIDEFEGLNKNQLFEAAEIYLGTIISPSTKRFRASLPTSEKKIQVSMARNEELKDNFNGFQLKWRMVCKKNRSRHVPYSDDYHSSIGSEVRYLELSYHKKYKTKVLDEYLPYILQKSKAIKEEKKTLKLYTLKNERVHGPGRKPWQGVNLDHPATFDTLAMDTEIKNMVIDDLDRFVKRKEFYRKVGKAWKRGYLLFGPPGTGKSSLIAAMANYLNFDVYDLELTDLRSNSDLRRLLISTDNRSILVVEDIDASIDLSSKRTPAAPRPSPMYPYQYDQGPKVTLSGLLNFIDGLWSSVGDERIIVFTTNHKEKLDPALLRPGRMDVHIHMSYCTPCGFKMLASNYLGITEHSLMPEVERLIGTIKATPAEIGEQLLKSDNPETALEGMIEFLHRKKEEDEAKARQEIKIVNEPEEKEDETDKMKDVKGMEGLKEFIKMAKGSPPAELEDQIVKKEGLVDALKGLIEFLEGKNGAEDVKVRETDAGASKIGTVPEANKEGGMSL